MAVSQDPTIKTSYRLKKSIVKKITAFREKAGYLNDSEAVRVLLSTALEAKEKEMEEQNDRYNTVSVKRKHSIE